MNYQIKQEIVDLGGDSSSLEWEWFVTRGPHGEYFTWSQTKNEPTGYVGLEHLERIINEYIDDDDKFVSKIIEIIKKSLQSNKTNFLRRAIQIASIVGDQEIYNIVKTLVNSEDIKVAGDAKACLFVLKRRLKK